MGLIFVMHDSTPRQLWPFRRGYAKSPKATRKEISSGAGSKPQLIHSAENQTGLRLSDVPMSAKTIAIDAEIGTYSLCNATQDSDAKMWEFEKGLVCTIKPEKLKTNDLNHTESRKNSLRKVRQCLKVLATPPFEYKKPWVSRRERKPLLLNPASNFQKPGITIVEREWWKQVALLVVSGSFMPQDCWIRRGEGLGCGNLGRSDGIHS